MKKQFSFFKITIIILIFGVFAFVNQVYAETNDYQLNKNDVQYTITPLIFNEGDREPIELKLKILSSNFDYTKIKSVYFKFYNYSDDLRFSFSKGIFENDWNTDNKEFTFSMANDWSTRYNAELISIDYQIKYQNTLYSIPIDDETKIIVIPTVPITCNSFIYSNWSSCSEGGQQTRSIISSSPSGCSGGNPVSTQSCTYVSPVCTSWTYSDWSSCQSGDTKIRTIISSSPNGCTGGNPILTQSCTYIAPTCTSWIYSDWGTCSDNGQQTRSIISSSPSGCSNGNPILTQSCTYIYTPPTCTSWTYSDWSICTNNQQTRTIISSQPANCIGGNPILNETCNSTPACSENDWTSLLTPTACPNNDQQTKTWYKIGQCQEGATHPSIETVSCNYQTPTCNNFIYSDWGSCGSSGVQSRTVFSSSPANCIGGNPILNQTCTYIPPCIADNWSCSIWSNCSSNGVQVRTCNKILNCEGGVSSPAITQSCVYTLPDKQENVGSLSNGILVRIKGTAGVYLIYNNQKRPIKSAAVFLGRGYKWKDIIDVDANILNVYPTGLELTISEVINIVSKNQGIKIKINVPSLRVRSLPNANGKIITSVQSGKEYQVIEQQTGWYKINYIAGKTGWIMSQYTKIIK